jgi:hypothetical protein
VIGLFDSISEAQDAVRALVNAGFSRDDISYVSSTIGTKDDVEHAQSGAPATEAMAIGAAGGAGLGGLTGFLVGVGAITLPGIGPAIAAGALASTLIGAGVGAAVGGLAGAGG